MVHLISGGDAGGAKTHVLSLLAGLPGRGCAATLVCFRDGPFAEEARRLGIDTRVICGNGVTGDLRALETLIRNGNYDAVHSHGSRGNTFSALLKPRLGLPALTTIHSDYKLDYMGSPARALTYGVLNRLALKRMDGYICVSGHLTGMLIGRGFMPSRMYTIYNGIDQPGGVPDSAGFDRKKTLSAWGLNYQEGDMVIGCAARFDPVKDLGTLLRAVHMAARHCPGIKLILAGDGPERRALESLIERLGIWDRVCLPGWIGADGMDAFYRSLDVNVLTSKYETFGYVLLEGALRGVPAVASRVGGIPEVVDHGVNGLLFKPGDAAELTMLLRSMYDGGAQKRERYGSRLKQKAETRFSLSATVDTQIEIYQTAVRRAARSRERAGARDGVLLCGAYGFGNAGDNGILAAILEQLKQLDPDMPVCVLSRKPRGTARQFRADTQHTFDLFKLTRELKRRAVYVNGGGNLIQDATSSRSLWFYLFTLWTAKRCGAKTLMYACGVGPVSRKFNRRLTARVLNRRVDAITMREDNTPAELESLCVSIPRAALTADPALCLKPAPPEAVEAAMREMGLDPDGAYMCLSVRRWPGFDETAPEFAALVNAAWNEFGLSTVILPFETRGDSAAAALVSGRAKAPCITVRADYPPDVLIGVISRMRVMIGMRLHALIFAAGQGVPLAGVSYDSKSASFLRYLGQDLCCGLDGVTAKKLISMLRACMSQEPRSQPREEAVGRLRELESGNIEMLKELL